MPWNCLCSSKEKRRPQISAPILNPEDTQKLQLIPLKKVRAATRDPVVSPPPADDSRCANNNNDDDDRTTQRSSPKSCLSPKKQKQLNNKKHQKEKSNGKQPKQSAKGGKKKKNKSSGSPDDAEVDGNANEPTLAGSVQFAFEPSHSRASTAPPSNPARKRSADDGTYDVLPLIRIDEYDEDEHLARQEMDGLRHSSEPPHGTDSHPRPLVRSTGFGRSADSIPFIDESPRKVLNYHEERFITIEPQNLGSAATKALGRSNKLVRVTPPTVRAPLHPPMITVGDHHQVVGGGDMGAPDTSAQMVVYRPAVVVEAAEVAHHFRAEARVAAKLCQMCHEFLHEQQVAVRCLTCGLVCHEQCAELKAKIRYTDTAYVVHQQWRMGGDLATFPILHHYVQRRLADQKQHQTKEDQPAARCRCAKSEPLLSERKQRRRKSRSLERQRSRRNPPATPDRVDGTAAPDETSTDDEEPADRVHETVPAHPGSGSVVAEVYHRVDSTVGPGDDVSDTGTVRRSESSDGGKSSRDINANQAEVLDRNRPPPLLRRTSASPVAVRRPAFEPISDSSTSCDESASEYASVQFRNQKNYDAHQMQQGVPKSQSYPVSNNQVTLRRHPQPPTADHLGLSYVTERILASVLPLRSHHNGGDQHQRRHTSDGHQSDASTTPTADVYERELVQMLEQKHGKNYKLFDLESCIATITLEKLCELCKHIDAWLGSGRDKVVVLQDRGDKQRLGSAIAAYLEYLHICGTSTSAVAGSLGRPSTGTLGRTGGAEDARAQSTIARNWLDLDIFSMKKFLEDVVGPLRVPSHQRYLHYFAGLLSGQIKMNAAALHLRYITIESPPSWLNYEQAVESDDESPAEWRTFVKVYEGLNCVFTSDIHVIPVSTRQFVFEIGQLRLRGDVIVRCYQIVPNERVYQERRELILSTQFHTCAITERTISFGRADLDYACDDPRFPNDHRVTLHFEKSAQSTPESGYPMQSPLVKIEPVTSIAKYDSLENFDDAASQHTQGPLDGSLYATILKSPRSPEHSPSTFPFTAASPVAATAASPASKPQRAASTVLISPPPEFSNHTREHRDLSRSQSYTPQPLASSSRISYEEIRIPASSGNNGPRPINGGQRATYNGRPGSTQSQYADQARSVSRSSNYTSVSQPLRSVEPPYQHHQDHRPSLQNGNAGYGDGSATVRSPLTVSMDSGISSNDVVNRRTQGSSVSPSSFPSQSSPQDRDRELDDILSDMLMTVKDIPDMGKSSPSPASAPSTHNTLTKKPHNLTIHLSPQPQPPQSNGNHNNNYQHHPFQHTAGPTPAAAVATSKTSRTESTTSSGAYDTNYDTIKRSPQNRNGGDTNNNNHHHNGTLTRNHHIGSHPSATSANAALHDGDAAHNRNSDHLSFYETSSTTTTITPPASESGRDTPLSGHHHHHHQNNHHQQQQQHQRDLYQNVQSLQQSHAINHPHHHQHNTNSAVTHSRHTMDVVGGGISAASARSGGGGGGDVAQQQQPHQSHSYHFAQQSSRDRETPNHLSHNAQPLDSDTTRRSSTASIPYHAREDSRPFTYGNPTGVQLHQSSSAPTNGHQSPPSQALHPQQQQQQQQQQQPQQDCAPGTPNGTGMLKMQSGLSSPSLVRRTLNTPIQTSGTTPRKSNIRNDFEEMLLQRREKVMSDKYSIGDQSTGGQSPPAGGGYAREVKWANNNTTSSSVGTGGGHGGNASTGYQYEPLRRANTMDGGFGRSHSTDGTGQTWLQLQQQKLRAKKGLPNAPSPSPSSGGERREYIERQIYTENRTRPVRSRSSAPRYDGYASDTAAFDANSFIDEVDYRRPLHVQMPQQANRNYHTLSSSQSTLTTTHGNERPFVSVKRAHAQNMNGSAPVSPLSALYASPLGHVAQAQSTGLLSVADHSPTSPNASLNSSNGAASPMSRNGHTRLTSERLMHNGSPDDSLSSTLSTDDSKSKSSSAATDDGLPEELSPPGDEIASGQAALDRLLASLAIESDLMDQGSSGLGSHSDRESSTSSNSSHNRTHTNRTAHSSSSESSFGRRSHSPNDGNIFKYPSVVPKPQPHRDINHNHTPKPNADRHRSQNLNNNNEIHSNLDDVLQSLTDFTRTESMRHQRSKIGAHRTPLRRLASESEDADSSAYSPSLSERSHNGMVSWSDQVREESFSSYRSETEPEISIAGSPRPETPAFPVTPRTPYGLNGNYGSPALPPKSPNTIRRFNNSFNNSTWSLRSAKSSLSTYDWSKDLYSSTQNTIYNQNDAASCYASRRNSNTSTANSEPQDVPSHLVKFVRDSSQFWYKPTISRDEAVALLRHAPPGTFIVRDSTTFAKAYGLVVKVAYPPPGVTPRNGPNSDELVRHFLVEPTTRGVRLKGCANEPVFTSLSALVYQHSITPLALPCKLLIPEHEMYGVEHQHSPAQQQLITQGAACNLMYLFTCETESLTGPEAVRKAISLLFSRKPLPAPTTVHFKVSQQGITLTDNTRQLFFRKHYPAANISHCGLDPDDRRWSIRSPTADVPVNKAIFAFVARRSGSATDNQCHVFCEMEAAQPATAIASFANKVIPNIGHTPAVRFI